MRVMLMVFPTRTHVYSMAPVGWALAAAGHEVRFVGQRNPREVASFAETGLDAMWFGDELDIARHRQLQVDGNNAMQGDFRISESRPERYTDEYVRNVYEHWVDVFRWTTPDSLLDELVRFARQWQPDLVVWDPMIYAAPIVAHALGVPHLRMMYAADQTARIGAQYRDLRANHPEDTSPDPFVTWMSAAVGRFGADYDETLRYGVRTIDCHPSYLRYDGVDVDYVPARFVPQNKPMAIPSWVLERPERPRVMLTLGISNRQVLGVEETSVGDLLDGLADLDLEVIATLNASQLASVRSIPDNVRAVDFVPMNELLASCSAIVHQGGGATISNAVVNGVPQLVIPGTTWSERGSAVAQAKRGNGLLVDLEDVTPASVRAGVCRLLEEPSFRECALEVRDEMLATPTLDDLVPELERLALCP
ncbi:L-2-deoxyfucosyltransferase/glycosyltransferase DesVII [Amycolatopsis echigonensis]|uniref:L-2-deoxyfucosyltransferase/glycosyltransferase DesVII n=1 Tax=Amycolatopsis echigonensis TaxID=2576905 RepID=A0A2N3WMD6_9PSEU|nr:nucleotide disphospho-sugar-binding domain-containing protein [Amycolatopsis niigatensis]PKV95034.1 L-2-deoxyfucosyltransferase/glycosyltransferase DesVII [Amycolatopsis niigatensis]